jgi:hypothetical protein
MLSAWVQHRSRSRVKVTILKRPYIALHGMSVKPCEPVSGAVQSMAGRIIRSGENVVASRAGRN